MDDNILRVSFIELRRLVQEGKTVKVGLIITSGQRVGQDIWIPCKQQWLNSPGTSMPGSCSPTWVVEPLGVEGLVQLSPDTIVSLAATNALRSNVRAKLKRLWFNVTVS